MVPQAEFKLRRRAEALFHALSGDYLLREQFVTDPAQIMAEYILGQHPSAETIDAANQTIYAVMSSPRLRNWLEVYASQVGSTLPSPHEFAVQFSRAVSSSGDDAATLALIRGAAT